MSNVEVEDLKADISEIKTDLKEVAKAVNNVQVILAGQYVPKEDFVKHQESDSSSHKEIHKRIDKLVMGVSAATILFLLKILWDILREAVVRVGLLI